MANGWNGTQRGAGLITSLGLPVSWHVWHDFTYLGTSCFGHGTFSLSPQMTTTSMHCLQYPAFAPATLPEQSNHDYSSFHQADRIESVSESVQNAPYFLGAARWPGEEHGGLTARRSWVPSQASRAFLC